MTQKKALVTGISGQDGSYLAELLLSKDYEVHGIIRRSSSLNTARIDHIFDQLHLHYGDLSDGSALGGLLSKVKPDEVYNLGAQSHVRVSFDCPEYTADIDAMGTLRLIEAVKAHCPEARYYQASSSELFGKVAEVPQSEKTPFYPRSPYGVAKLFGYWYTVNAREQGLHASNGILFNHECVTAETPIIYKINETLDIAEIQELVPHRSSPKHGKKYQTIPKKLHIWNGTAWTKVTLATATWNAIGDKDVFSIQARGGCYRATEDHVSFLKGRVPIKTKDIKELDNLQLYPLPFSLNVTTITKEEAKFLGLMAGDGYVCSEGGSARFTNTDVALLEEAARLFIKITGGKCRKDYSKSSGYTGEMVPSVEFSGAIPFFSLWRSELYNERGFKKVPKRILNAGKELQKEFLIGYNLADGLKEGNKVQLEFKSFKTDSSVLAQGLCFIVENLELRAAIYLDRDKYYTINVGHKCPTKGFHLQKPLEEVRKVKKVQYVGWLFDLETEDSTFSAGVGRTWVHNSPRRGETFVTHKITKAAARIKLGMQKELLLGNLEARRDWGHAKDYVEAMYLMLQQDQPDDYVISTGESYTIKELLDVAFNYVGLDWSKYVGVDPRYYRPTEVDILQGDSSKAKRMLGWEPKVKFKELIEEMVEADLEGLRK